MKLINLLLLLLITSCAIKVVNQPIEPSEPINATGNLFSYKSSLNWVKDLSEKANCVIGLKSFKDVVEAVEKFDYSNDNGKQVYAKFAGSSCTIRTYKTTNPWSKAIATTYSTDKENFYLNTRKNPREMKYMINTSFHECLHLLGYSHGSNSSIGKENSVNYFVGKLAENVSGECL